MEKPEWMKDEALSGIPAAKLELLSEIHERSKGKNQKELIAYFAQISRRQKERDALSFTREELKLILDTIKKHATQEERQKMDQMLKKQFPPR